MTAQKRTRSALVIEIMKLILEQYPIAWKAREITTATKTGQRTVERALADMTDAGLLEKRYHDYTLSTRLVKKLYSGETYFRQQMDKDILLTHVRDTENRKEKQHEKDNSSRPAGR